MKHLHNERAVQKEWKSCSKSCRWFGSLAFILKNLSAPDHRSSKQRFTCPHAHFSLVKSILTYLSGVFWKEKKITLVHMTRCHDNSNCDSDVWIWFLHQVWNSNAVKDEFMGQVVLPGSPKDSPNPQKLQLRKAGRNATDEMPGSITLKIVTATQLTAIWPPRRNWLRSIFLPTMSAFVFASLGEKKGKRWTKC